MTGNTAAWIILLALACAVVIAVLTGLWVSWRRELRRDYHPAHGARRRRPSGGAGQRGLTWVPSADHPFPGTPGKAKTARSVNKHLNDLGCTPVRRTGPADWAA